MRWTAWPFLVSTVTCLPHWNDPIVVPKGDNTNPCGLGVECVSQHTCCNEYETCGGETASVGCPKGMCCYIGDGDFGAATPDSGASPHRAHPQVSYEDFARAQRDR